MTVRAIPWDDDLLAMERSTFATFIDESQANLLLELWLIQERGDDAAFIARFCREDDEDD